MSLIQIKKPAKLTNIRFFIFLKIERSVIIISSPTSLVRKRFSFTEGNNGKPRARLVEENVLNEAKCNITRVECGGPEDLNLRGIWRAHIEILTLGITKWHAVMTKFILGLNHSLMSLQIPFLSHAIPFKMYFSYYAKYFTQNPFLFSSLS